MVVFGPRGSGDATLWLWIMPLPPPGEVRLTVEWRKFGIEPVTVSFDGATIRPRERPNSSEQVGNASPDG